MKSYKVVELTFEYIFEYILDDQMSQNNRHCAKVIILKLSLSNSIEVIFKRPLVKFRPGVMRLMRVIHTVRILYVGHGHLVVEIIFEKVIA